MSKSKLWMLAALGITLLMNLVSGKAQEEQIREEIGLALEEKNSD